MTGRPSDYSLELSDIICARIVEGESMRSIGRDDTMPAMSTLFKWLREHDEFSEQYARAHEASADVLFDDMLEIADDGTNDWMEKNDKKGECIGWQLNGEHIQRSKLRIETRKWAASKLKPKKYGDTQHIDVSDVTPPPPERRKSRMSELLGKCLKS